LAPPPSPRRASRLATTRRTKSGDFHGQNWGPRTGHQRGLFMATDKDHGDGAQDEERLLSRRKLAAGFTFRSPEGSLLPLCALSEASASKARYRSHPPDAERLDVEVPPPQRARPQPHLGRPRLPQTASHWAEQPSPDQQQRRLRVRTGTVAPIHSSTSKRCPQGTDWGDAFNAEISRRYNPDPNTCQSGEIRKPSSRSERVSAAKRLNCAPDGVADAVPLPASRASTEYVAAFPSGRLGVLDASRRACLVRLKGSGSASLHLGRGRTSTRLVETGTVPEWADATS